MTQDAQNPRTLAEAAGCYVREGSYQGTTDDRLGRWYVGIRGFAFAPWGEGHATEAEAWTAALETARELGLA